MNTGHQPNAKERKTVILNEAARLIREKGYGGTTLRELAKRSGIQGGSIYHHFASKQEILFRIMDNTMTRLTSRVQKAVDDVNDPSGKLAQAIRSHIEYHTVEPDKTYITDAELRSLAPENHEIIVRMRDKYERLYVQIIKEGIQKGQMEISHVKLTIRALLQACTGVSYWFKPKGPLSVGDIADNYINLFFRGISKQNGK